MNSRIAGAVSVTVLGVAAVLWWALSRPVDSPLPVPAAATEGGASPDGDSATGGGEREEAGTGAGVAAGSVAEGGAGGPGAPSTVRHVPGSGADEDEGEDEGGHEDDAVRGGTRYGDWDFSQGLPRGWTAAGEARRLFEPMQKGFDAAQPLTPAAFKEVVAAHRSQGLEVLKEAAAVSRAGYEAEGKELLEGWNSLYRSYQERAYPKPAR